MLFRRFLLLIVVASALACNAPFLANNVAANVTNTPAPSGPPPAITIESPQNGVQVVLKEPFQIRVHATDSVGITRVEMHESGRIVVSQPSPQPSADFTALMEYNPTTTGDITLEVVAFRHSVPSQPVNLTVKVVSSKAQLDNPGSLDPTSGAAAGAICMVRVNVSGLNMRTGPGTKYRVLGKVNVGDELVVLGRNKDISWYYAKGADGKAGWVSAGYVTAQGDCNPAPEITPSP